MSFLTHYIEKPMTMENAKGKAAIHFNNLVAQGKLEPETARDTVQTFTKGMSDNDMDQPEWLFNWKLMQLAVVNSKIDLDIKVAPVEGVTSKNLSQKVKEYADSTMFSNDDMNNLKTMQKVYAGRAIDCIGYDMIRNGLHVKFLKELIKYLNEQRQ